MKILEKMVSVIVVCAYLFVMFFIVSSAILERKTVEYLKSSTEDEGDYSIMVYPFKYSNREGLFYFASMIDDDGDWKLYIIRKYHGDFTKQELLWN